MPPERATERTATSEGRERAEGREGRNDASTALSRGVSNQEMRDFHRNRNNNNGGNDDAMAAFGSLSLFLNEMDEDAFPSTGRGTDAARRGTDASQQGPDATRPSTDSHINTLPPPPAVLSSQFATQAEALFDRINTNGDDHLGTDELAAAVQDAQFRGQDAQVLAALYSSRDSLQALSNDEWGWENDGITRADLQAFDQSRSAHAELSNSTALADASFDRFDANHDGYFARSEVDAALQSAPGDYERSQLQFLSDRYDAIQSTSNDEWGFERSGITREDLSAYWRQSNQTAVAQTETEANATITRTSESQVNHLNSGLFATPDDPTLSITPDAVAQGGIGDCYLLAAISSLAATNPQAIRDMIRDNNNGTYTVTFPGDPENPVTVNAPTEAERGLYNGGHKYGTWAGVLERAYGQYQVEHGGIIGQSFVSMESGGNTTAENAGGGGTPASAMQFLTGRDTDYVSTSFVSNSELAARLDQALNSDSPTSVTASIHGSFISSESADGYARRHAYSIIDFQPDGNGSGLVTVRNPWGENNDSTSGTTQITLEALQRNFSALTFEVAA